MQNLVNNRQQNRAGQNQPFKKIMVSCVFVLLCSRHLLKMTNRGSKHISIMDVKKCLEVKTPQNVILEVEISMTKQVRI